MFCSFRSPLPLVLPSSSFPLIYSCLRVCRNVNRMPAEKLFLVALNALTDRWEFPSVQHKASETLRATAERASAEHLGWTYYDSTKGQPDSSTVRKCGVYCGAHPHLPRSQQQNERTEGKEKKSCLHLARHTHRSLRNSQLYVNNTMMSLI